MGLATRLVSTPAWRVFAKYYYPFITRHGADDVALLNLGYEEDPPMAIPLSESDEPDRYCIQLYHRTATQADIAGKQVLEVSCGHGGGASYLMRTLCPASYTGLDLNPAGIEVCRTTHRVPGLDFVQGDAQNLPFPDNSFDVIINIEASHCYPSLPRFLAEVARVLRPGGHLLYADVRHSDHVAEWEAELADAPLRMRSKEIISEQVVRGLEKSLPRSQNMFTRRTPAMLRGLVRDAVATSNSKICRGLQNGESSYRMYCFENE
ncbi:MAG: class I SAM-dependent methyltransferase [Mycobacterium pseudokansasii]|uniref:Phthiotriol/phenolphthiotriol dimycocerosates methyltransferase n=1 Tax=Mycobacterium pseudokansasii TaxID=2341080 RepID=A0A498QVW3_9MYCO|nr:class I SAM-dependent methyltransferase [Mycobacterium pseudokansasii]KZS66381.1 methyltransferase [Mycobacterium kansasii]MBY0389743.1 class I SAM-dependent methyltransferase [Mycobacterium pseudokansasii]VAZ97930.1 Phthiotriol/phenolphthiotriol dimycocerosates methyltransferase [Mycobacterium pseudokansasii]VAZ99439.1 Phthiotriol/phenolphthiotriol dimycocerosates methyltransferase [Mycobacterium pseudokansasii]VBA52867.1 Phthiotriol/phenolphthiotriol dimycocerosates methyltransferase [Myc